MKMYFGENKIIVKFDLYFFAVPSMFEGLHLDFIKSYKVGFVVHIITAS